MKYPFKKSLIRIAGDQHHFRELQKLESMLYSKFDLPKMYEDLVEFLEKEFPEKTAKTITIRDLSRIDNFIKNQTITKITVAEQYIVRAFVVGHIMEERTGRLTAIIKPQGINVDNIPGTLKAAIKEYKLSQRDIEALNTSMSHTAQHLTSATNVTVNKVQSLTTDNLLKHGSRKELAEKLKEEFFDNEKEINRNWNRVAINETSYAYNNGYLASMKPGQWVIGISMPDRCESCGALIDGKVYYYTNSSNEDMKYDDLKPDSKEYQRRAWLTENTIWLYKDNYGRSASKNKRTEGGTVKRKHHELSMPAVPNHPLCRCVWSKFNPEYQFVDKEGTVKMRAMDENAWKRFNEMKIQPIKEKLKEHGIKV
jgi:hypothetical protein